MAISNVATEVLADGPIGYWRLGEAIGIVTADDASGNGNSGRCSGAIIFGQPAARVSRRRHGRVVRRRDRTHRRS
jgi:hypothetical protein